MYSHQDSARCHENARHISRSIVSTSCTHAPKFRLAQPRSHRQGSFSAEYLLYISVIIATSCFAAAILSFELICLRILCSANVFSKCVGSQKLVKNAGGQHEMILRTSLRILWASLFLHCAFALVGKWVTIV